MPQWSAGQVTREQELRTAGGLRIWTGFYGAVDKDKLALGSVELQFIQVCTIKDISFRLETDVGYAFS